jgi:zinc transporter ZupT
LECIGDEENHQENDKPWGQVIASSLLVNLVTLAGLFVVVGEWVQHVFCPARSMSKQTVNMWRWNIIPMFATGALFATAFFLILPEALALIQTDLGGGHDDHDHRRFLREVNPESATAWRWGTAVLVGALIPYFTHALYPHDHSHDRQETECETISQAAEIDSACDGCEPEDAEKDNKAVHGAESTEKSYEAVQEGVVAKDPDDQEERAEKPSADVGGSGASIQRFLARHDDRLQNVALLVSLSVADFFHQFADGVFLGTAWLLCQRDVAIVVAISTVIHCFPHQLADYLMMVHHCGLKETWALLLNFIVGLGTLLGGLVVLGVSMSNTAIGVILAIGAGTFLQVGFCECLVMAETNQKNFRQKALGFLAFLVGCVPIGLVLLKHEHCHAH